MVAPTPPRAPTTATSFPTFRLIGARSPEGFASKLDEVVFLKEGKCAYQATVEAIGAEGGSVEAIFEEVFS